jgi:hypothetical protein
MPTWLIQIIIGLALSYVASLFAPKQEPPKASELSDFDIAKAEEGDEIIKPFGTVLITSPQVHGFGDFETVAIKDDGDKK